MFMVIIFLYLQHIYLIFKKIATRLDTFLNINKIELCFYFASLNTLLTVCNSIEAYVWSHAIVTRLKDRTKALSKSSKAKFESVGRRKIIPSLCFKLFLTLPARCISESSVKTKINLNFIFALLCGSTSLWYFKRFSQKDLKGLLKPFEAPQRSVKIKINKIELCFFFAGSTILLSVITLLKLMFDLTSLRLGLGREGLTTQPAFTYSELTVETRIRCKICSKLTIKTPEWHQSRRFGVFIVNFEHISYFFYVSII